MSVKLPEKKHVLGGPLPPIPQKVASWPWGNTPSLMQWSLDQLKHPLGTLIYEVVDGHPVLAQIQTHYSYGAHPDWPDKAHKGTSVYVPVATDAATGRSVPMREAPEGWGDDATMGFDWWIPSAFVGGGAAGLIVGGIAGLRAASWAMGKWLGQKHPEVLSEFMHDGTLPPTYPHPAPAQISGEMYTRRRGGGYRFSGEDEADYDSPFYVPLRCEPFGIRRHGMIY